MRYKKNELTIEEKIKKLNVIISYLKAQGEATKSKMVIKNTKETIALFSELKEDLRSLDKLRNDIPDES